MFSSTSFLLVFPPPPKQYVSGIIMDSFFSSIKYLHSLIIWGWLLILYLIHHLSPVYRYIYIYINTHTEEYIYYIYFVEFSTIYLHLHVTDLKYSMSTLSSLFFSANLILLRNTSISAFCFIK